ncbi:MAG: nucleotidyltransferase family protein, partial [Lentihominibacter sp.]
MKQLYRDYLAFLRAFVQESHPELSDEIDWNEILHIARINSTVGIVGYVLMMNPDLADPGLQAFMRKQCLSEIALYSRRAEQMKELIKQMNACGMDHLLFKGFIVREYYCVPELRTFGDIDFVIRKSDREKSDALMKKLGYEPHENWEPVFSYLKGTEYYEIHTNVMEVDVSDKADYKSYYSHIWDHAVQSTDPAQQHTY